MKASLVAAAAAAIVGGASAHGSHHRRAHENLFVKRQNGTELGVCVPGVPACTTVYTTITGDIIWQPTPDAKPLTSSSATTTMPVTVKESNSPASSTSAAPAVVPTPAASTLTEPGTYTIPATTIVVTSETTVCGASTTAVPSAGNYTLGGVTTVVVEATTVVCPYATVKTQSGGVVTSVVETTTYVCPAAGTYTIAPITTSASANETVVVPQVTSYAPGTYTAPSQVVTVVETATVVYCPFSSADVPSATPSTSAAPVIAVAPVQTSIAAIIPALSIPALSIPALSIPALSIPALSIPQISASIDLFPSPSVAASSATPSATTVPTLGGSGNKWAMTYTPFTSTGECKTADDVLTDIASIAAAGFTTLRVYSTDCDTLPNVGAAATAHGLKMIVGIFIGEVGCDNGMPDVADQISALVEWSRWDLVELASVGNEALYNGYCTAQQLADLITHVKSELGATGYTGPITTTDTVAAWQLLDVATLICPVIDVVSANIHAYFNADILPIGAGLFVEAQLAIVETICGKDGVVLETGFPHSGVCNGLNCPSEENQAIAIGSIQETLGNKVAFFSMFDDLWKSPGDCNCEQAWGCGQLFGVEQ